MSDVLDALETAEEAIHTAQSEHEWDGDQFERLDQAKHHVNAIRREYEMLMRQPEEGYGY